MSDIKFGTDGWRAIIARDFTEDNVKRVAEASANWMEERGYQSVVIGYDCRFGGQMFAEATARVFGTQNIKVYLSSDFVSTPMVSLGVVKTGAKLGVVITASHNPPSYNGYKLKSLFGGPTIPSEIAEVEALMPSKALNRLLTLDEIREKGLLEIIDLEQMYYDHVVEHFDLDAIRNSGIKIGYDAMYGAGQRIFKRILPSAICLHDDFNPWFNGQAPEPILRNLHELASLIKERDDIKLGIANDGDADRIGMFDEDGTFVDSHRILLLLLYYMFKFKNLNGKVVVTFSVTDKMQKLAEKFGLDFEVTKIGFKYIAEIMTREDILVGGEESGGLAVKGHIPERDGIWIGLVILEFMAKSGKTVKELVEMIYDEVGKFSFDRDDLHITEEQKSDAINRCREQTFSSIGNFKITNTETIDGFKFFMGDDAWVMIRPSGTEPVLRVYAQGTTDQHVREILDQTQKTLLD
jgi:phosphomannomutase